MHNLRKRILTSSCDGFPGWLCIFLIKMQCHIGEAAKATNLSLSWTPISAAEVIWHACSCYFVILLVSFNVPLKATHQTCQTMNMSRSASSWSQLIQVWIRQAWSLSDWGSQTQCSAYMSCAMCMFKAKMLEQLQTGGYVSKICYYKVFDSCICLVTVKLRI